MKHTLCSLLVMAALFFALPAHAGFCEDAQTMTFQALQQKHDGFSSARLAEELGNCKTTSDVVQNITSATPEETARWGQVAKDFAHAVGIAANELGMATNNFLQTPAGKLTAIIIGWKVLGDDVAAIAEWFMEAIICIPIGIMLLIWWRRWFSGRVNQKVTYEQVPVLWGMWTRTRVKEVEAMHYSDGEELFTGSMVFGIATLLFLGIGIF